jgi:hypothetical protein
VLVLLVACSWPYSSYSEVVNGSTENASSSAYTWVMQNILPAQTGLTIEGVYHKYTITKDANADAIVSITNENIDGNGYIYEYHDNWDQLPSNTKFKYDPIASSLGALWGKGEIKVIGDGTLSDVNIRYQYKFDTCFIPLSDPTCPDFRNALYQYLIDNDLLNNEPSIDDPYYNEWVKLQLEQQVEEEKLEAAKEEEPEEEEKEKLTMQDLFSVDSLTKGLADPFEQVKMLQEMAALGKLDSYYGVEIQGGVYKDTIKLVDGSIKDNTKALRNLAQDKAHEKMVSMQYDK